MTRLYLIEGADVVDALVRVLGLFAIQQVRLSNVEFAADKGRMTLKLEAQGLDVDRADYLRRKLQLLPLVTSVATGWRRQERD